MAYERTWQFAPSMAQRTPASVAEACKYTHWTLKAFLLGQIGGATSGLWTCIGSCDGTTAALDGVDRWGSTFDPTKIVQANAGTAHSWTVLESPVLASGIRVYMLIDAVSTGQAYLGALIFAKVAFTGGTTTASPTSTDSWNTAGLGLVDTNSVLPQRFHGALSAQGDFFMWGIRAAQNGGIENFTAVIAPVGASASDLYPVWAQRQAAQNVTGTIPVCAYGLGIMAATVMPCRNYLGALGQAGLLIQTVPASVATLDVSSGKLLDFPLWLAVKTGAASLHMRGRLPDIGGTPDNGSYAVSGASVPPGTAVRDGSNNVIYITLGISIVPFNVVPDFS